MIEAWLRILRTANIELDARDMADALWLAQVLPEMAPDATEDATIDGSAAEPHDTEQAAAGGDKPRDETAANAEVKDAAVGTTRRVTITSRSVLRDSADLFVRPSKPAHPDQDNIRVSRVRVPAAPGLHNAFAIARALRPLARRFPSRHSFSLDEEATAERSAETGVLTPVFKPDRERRFEIALVVEDLPSIALWRRPIAEFHRLLQQHGAFRDVRRWTLSFANGGAHLIDPTGGVRAPGELRHPEARRIVLVVSDCLSPAWYGRSMATLLADWGASTPVAVMQLLPEHLWPNTALGPARARLGALLPATPNAGLSVERAWWDDDAIDGHVPLPVLTLDGASVGEWSRLLMGVGTRARGVLVSQHLQSADELQDRVPEAAIPPANAEERLNRFRALVSADAFRLATFLSVVPLSLPVMRLVQSSMFASPSESQMAEVLLGGIIERVTPANARVDDDEVLYEFASSGEAADDGAALRDLFLRSIRRSEMQRVIDVVSQYVADRAGSPVDFHAWVQSDAGTDVLPAEARPFARLARTAMARVGVAAPTLRSDASADASTIEEEVFGEGLTIRQRIALDAGDVRHIAWSPNGALLAIRTSNANGSDTVQLLNALTGSLSNLLVFRGAMTAMVWSQSSAELAVAINDEYRGAGIFVCNVDAPMTDLTNTDRAPDIIPRDPVVELDWRAPFDEIAVAPDTGHLQLFRRVDGTLWRSFDENVQASSAGRPLSAISWSPNALTMALLYADGGMRMLSGSNQLTIERGTVGLTVPVFPNAPMHTSADPSYLGWHPAASWLAVVRPNGEVVVMSPQLQPLVQLAPPDNDGRRQSVSVSRDGALIAVASGTQLYLYRTRDWSVVSTTEPWSGLPATEGKRPMAFSPRDQTLAIVTANQELLLLRVDETALAKTSKTSTTVEFALVIAGGSRNPYRRADDNNEIAQRFFSWVNDRPISGRRIAHLLQLPESTPIRPEEAAAGERTSFVPFTFELLSTKTEPTVETVQHHLREYASQARQEIADGNRTRLIFYFVGESTNTDVSRSRLLLHESSAANLDVIAAQEYMAALTDSQLFDEMFFVLDCTETSIPLILNSAPTAGLSLPTATPNASARQLVARQAVMSSWQRATTKRGVFTDAIVSGLAGAAADSQGDVTATVLAGYVEKEIARASAESQSASVAPLQRPVFQITGDDFVLSRVGRLASRVHFIADPIYDGRLVRIVDHRGNGIVAFEYRRGGDGQNVVTVEPGSYAAELNELDVQQHFVVHGNGARVDVALAWVPTDYRVLVVGTGVRDLNVEENNAARELGRALAVSGLRLVTGGWPGVDTVVAATFRAEIEKQGENVSAFLATSSGSGSERISNSTINNLIQKVSSFTDDMSAELEATDALIVIGGVGGPERIMRAAASHGIPIIPWTATGGDATSAFASDTIAASLPTERELLAAPLHNSLAAVSVADRVAQLALRLINERRSRKQNAERTPSRNK